MREGRSIRSYRTPEREITIYRGAEGPSFDPYSYEEIEVKRQGYRTVTLHQGLGTWLRYDKERIDMNGRNLERRAVDIFEGYLGCSLEAFERAKGHIASRCWKCDGHAHHEISGYPGETFTVCQNGHVMDSYFNESAII